jgi:hypothetical protein
MAQQCNAVDDHCVGNGCQQTVMSLAMTIPSLAMTMTMTTAAVSLDHLMVTLVASLDHLMWAAVTTTIPSSDMLHQRGTTTAAAADWEQERLCRVTGLNS